MDDSVVELSDGDTVFELGFFVVDSLLLTEIVEATARLTFTVVDDCLTQYVSND